jgi:hypothetical protein
MREQFLKQAGLDPDAAVAPKKKPVYGGKKKGPSKKKEEEAAAEVRLHGSVRMGLRASAHGCSGAGAWVCGRMRMGLRVCADGCVHGRGASCRYGPTVCFCSVLP